MLIVPRSGLATMLSLIVNRVNTTENLRLRLYSNDRVPFFEDTFESYTEVSGGAYNSKELFGDSWIVSADTVPAVVSYPEVAFTFNGTPVVNVVHGYFVTRGDVLMWAERLQVPFYVANKGDQIRITPRFTLR